MWQAISLTSQPHTSCHTLTSTPSWPLIHSTHARPHTPHLLYPLSLTRHMQVQLLRPIEQQQQLQQRSSHGSSDRAWQLLRRLEQLLRRLVPHRWSSSSRSGAAGGDRPGGEDAGMKATAGHRGWHVRAVAAYRASGMQGTADHRGWHITAAAAHPASGTTPSRPGCDDEGYTGVTVERMA